MGIVRSKVKPGTLAMDKSSPLPYVSAFKDRSDGAAFQGASIMAKVGDKVPSATLRMLGAEGPKAVTTEELFAQGKKVVVFALPGAFTPT